MFRRIILLLFLLICLSVSGYSAVFVVTSNADSGPGTLREALALAAANGSVANDHITFNLTDLSVNGRTITLWSELPELSSNLVVDGSTQPGAKLGVSDARIMLIFNYNVPPDDDFSALTVLGQHDVEIYGLYLKYPDTQVYKQRMGIHLENSKNVTVGAAGKGNVVSGFDHPLIVNPPHAGQVAEFFENLIVKDNFFDVDADGETQSANETEGVSIYYVVGKIDIGGTAAEGNVFAKGMLNYQINNSDSTDEQDYYFSTPAVFNIKNNKIGTDYLGQKQILNSFGIELETVSPQGKNTFIITDNVIACGNSFGSLFAINSGGTLTLLRNFIGVDKSGTRRLGSSPNDVGLFLFNYQGDIIIGSDDPRDANVIAYCKPLSCTEDLKVKFTKNSFFCVHDLFPIYESSYYGYIPKVGISTINGTTAQGTATPNSMVELFYSDICETCSPQTFFAEVKADNNGNWKYSGNISGTVIASATLDGSTSEFTRVDVNTNNVKIINVCDEGTGSIIGAAPENATTVTWYDANNIVVGRNPDLKGVKKGIYRLTVANGTCSISKNFEIKDLYTIDLSAIKKVQPSCGNSKGAIRNVSIQPNGEDALVVEWQREDASVAGTAIDLEDVPAGTYTLIVKSSDGSCSHSYGPFTLKNATGPNIDQSGAKIQSTNCGQATGSITNITVTGAGNLQYLWWNSQQQQVGTQKDLTNQPAGIYKLQVLDDTQCGPIYTTDIAIPETNSITLDESKVTTSIASCSQNNGSIKGISFTGATKFQWMNASNQVVSNTADFIDAAPGVYTFTASNNFGCSKTSQPYTVGQQPPVQLPQYTATTVASCFGGKTGSVTVATDGLVKTLRWVDGQGGPAGNQPALTNVAAGIYRLYITDQNGCENLYNTYTVDEVPEYKVASAGQIINDQCGLNTGSVSNVNITGGVPPYTYKWTDAAGKQIGAVSAISNLPAGNYVLNVTDTRCGNVDIPYAIAEESGEVAAPSVSDMQLCSSGGALLSVNNASLAITYRLYETENSAHQIDEQKGGKFNVNVTANRSYFVTQLNGTCESAPAEVKITVGLSTINIANAFTPNGDGINDYWKISNIESYPGALVQVFTRYGQKVFESRGYAKPFDGTMNGKKLPPGVYYYIISLNTNCNVLSGSLTIIR